ncbi:hypothetical protein JG687_00015824 [Phytophthora cactorum]|uniref:Uncharacterized protein n=1 Tax=Phytophthora cactorum TaxID=29920 RepID=A0A8T1TSA2_9STRA|nr:hypothetical protein JG687_00015824 [Phytophthora cactorum]
MDSDPIRNDLLTCLFEVSPPSVSDERLARASIDYMVSCLAVQLSQHLWNHTSSCFKQCRATEHKTYCRYRFTRDRVEKTTFETSGVELSRKLGHEFINGFNCKIMATFRYNHDIQVLLGGSAVADQIHYCCKLGAQDRLALSHKRLAALAYSMTNRQEIAGPLAPLYLYRGSCCYSSGVCASLPLGDAIRQLSMTEYGRTLVNASDDVQKSKYRAVSNLDDYVFRPRNMETICLYEFTMWYFKKKSDIATSSRLNQHKAASKAFNGYPNETDGSDGSSDSRGDIFRDEFLAGNCDEVEDESTDGQLRHPGKKMRATLF